VPEPDWQHWNPTEFTVHLDLVFKSFGTTRILISSDRPACTLAATHGKVIQIAAEYVQKLSRDGQVAVWSQNAKSFYGIGDEADLMC